MFDIGFSEMFLILVIALVVVGPERLPGVARKIGRFIGHARRSFDHLKREISSELESEELNQQLAKNNILDHSKKIKQELKDMTAMDDKEKEVVQQALKGVNEVKEVVNNVNKKNHKSTQSTKST